ncbi:ras guanine nucleotide exchange factor domain-containing protein [Scheffersomyces coipomensis]|uniref:ras guanine nucleotide exchange factor domain-containing protein n=1 Tax=Scheffersomyces coipomensis TaxID=1788519 RepID=UPI00315C9608
MNYFEIAVDEKADSTINDIDDDGKIPNNKYLKPLFHSCAKFLMNPLSHKNRRGKYTFSIRTINSIRDGVRLLLQQTDCLSRSNEIVTKRPVVRKTRKSLLADWYNLMVKANEFKGTSNFNKIEILTLMIFQVTKKAVSFLKIWSIESKEILQQKQDSQKPGQIKESKSSNEDLNNYPLLASPPLAKQRITEINGILYSYLGLIIGRLDLIEHNPIGCDLLETIAHQIILLLRELLFISKTGSDFSSEKPADLDNSLDSLLSLVSDLVSSVKNLVVKTLNESESEKKSNVLPSMGNNADKYYYTQEGGNLIQIASKMIKSIGLTISSIRKLLDITGDFKLNSARSYPDYTKMKIDPEDFIKKCSIGIAKHNKRPDDDDEAAFRRPQTSAAVKNSNRYSMIRSGKTGELSLTSNGANLIHDVLLAGSNDANSPFSVSIPAFEPYTTATAANKSESNSNLSDINNELLVDSNGNLLGASFHGLVYTLTNEDSPPEYFFVSTFFICFRTFANGIDFIEEMISRFDITHNISSNLQGQTRADITAEVQLKKRRRLIVKMFQIWMESYWNHEADYSLLTTLINFFNEGISHFLPIEATKLIEIAAKLSTKPLIENQIQLRNLPRANGYNPQLISRSITITRFKRKNSFSSNTDNSLSNRYSMVDGYELSKINTNSSTTSSLKSISLPMPLGIGNQTSSSNSLLTKNQFQTIEKVNMTYRQILSTSWCPQKYIETSHYINLDISNLLGNWFQVCDQTWVLSNYRPNLLDFNGLELAKQLTSIESNIFCSIKPEELLNENFTAKRAYLRLAPNVRQSLLFTNCLSGYVLESILQPKINQKLRINMIKTWLKVAISCLYLRNFNSLAAIITALQSHLITRLNKIWGDLSDKYIELYEYLSSIIHPEKNYHVYRSKLKNFLISNDYNIPIVPYFSLFLQDLTFVTDGNPNYRKANTFLNQKLINIDKYLKITRIIADIESLQIPYTNSSTTTTSSKELRRSSISFNAKIPNSSTSTNLEMEDYTIVSVPSLQELILLELWKVCQLNKAEEDRAWKLSCTIQPRDVSSSSS